MKEQIQQLRSAALNQDRQWSETLRMEKERLSALEGRLQGRDEVLDDTRSQKESPQEPVTLETHTSEEKPIEVYRQESAHTFKNQIKEEDRSPNRI